MDIRARRASTQRAPIWHLKHRMRLAVFVFCLCFSSAAQEIRLNRLAGGLTLPSDLQHAGDGSGRLFVVQQNGRIQIWRDGALVQRPFLDIASRVLSGGERGLLGLAFPPGYATRRHFYVNYTDRQGDTVVARYRLTSDPEIADASSEELILRIDQPYSNHNGGQLRFGPDGYLYIGMGDGGSAGDPQNNAQNRSVLLGKLLRLDVEGTATPYGIPSDNPFAGGSAGRGEIWALGLRNPWRFSFDRDTGDLWIADVGQNRAEEVNFTSAGSRGGENYGWDIMEGLQCYPASAACSRESLVLPVLEYGRSEGCSVTGGFVYRGRRFPSLRGSYVYGDYCTGRIWGVRREGERWVNRLLFDSEFAISTFGEDESGEIYVADHGGGAIYLIETIGEGLSLSSDSVVNAASGIPGLVPGSLATIYAAGLRDSPGVTEARSLPLPTSLDGISVTIAGRPAPLLAVASTASGEQVNLQVPFSISGDSARVTVQRGSASASVDAAILTAQPGIFTSDGSAAIAATSDFRLITEGNPAMRNSIIVLYATGLGAVENTPASGEGAPSTPLSYARVTPAVRIGGIPAEVLFAGLAPGFAGVYQLNVRVPAGSPAGTVEAVIESGGATSRAARIPVR
jgi:uncharacterized protein (TIGR03437 family)